MGSANGLDDDALERASSTQRAASKYSFSYLDENRNIGITGIKLLITT